MFKVIKKDNYVEPRTVSKTIRIPKELHSKVEQLSRETNVNVSQIIIQMIAYCLNDK